MKTAYVVTTGGFDAGVVPPGPLEPAAPAKREQLRDDYMAMLTGLDPDQLSEKDERERERLVGWRITLNERSLALLERFRAQAREKVNSEWELAKKAVREQQEKIERHKNEIAAETTELNKLVDKRAAAISARDNVQQELRQLSRYAERREIERLNLLLTKREAEAEYATQQAGQQQTRINNMNFVDMKPLMERLNELIAEEAKLNHFVTGQSYTNEFGLVTPARPPL